MVFNIQSSLAKKGPELSQRKQPAGDKERKSNMKGRVKGTVMIDFVKTIKADRRGSYDQYLTDEDRQVMSERILPSGWYPYDTYKRVFSAVVKVLANNDMEKVRQWGRIYGETIVTNVYKGLIREGQPMETLKKYATYIRSFFDFGDLVIDGLSEREAQITFKGMDPDFQAQYYIMIGWMERSLEMCGAKGISSEFTARSWQGAAETKVRMSWS